MQRACLGFRVHSGWGALVAVSYHSGAWQVLDRRRISVVDRKIAGHAQPYHFAREQPLPQAEKHLIRCAVASLRLAQSALSELVGQLSRDYRVTGAAMLLASGRPLPDLDRILASHPLIHTAEGEFFRQAFSEATEALGIPVTRIRERDLAERPGGFQEVSVHPTGGIGGCGEAFGAAVEPGPEDRGVSRGGGTGGRKFLNARLRKHRAPSHSLGRAGAFFLAGTQG